MEQSESTRVIVIGTGFSGLCMGIKLRAAGLDDFVILEKGDDVGGVWRENTYPGACCDIPAELYSFSFEPKTDWTRRYPAQPEIQQYMRDCASKYGLYAHIRFGCMAITADYDQTAGEWTVTTADGTVLRAAVLICGMGQLSRPAMPDIAGRDRFLGESFHSANWDAGFRSAGKRIGVIGTGASAIQFIPELARDAARLEVFQRTPPYVMPKPDRAYNAVDLWLMRNFPGYKELNRAAWYQAGETSTGAFNKGSRLAGFFKWLTLGYMRRHVKDEALRAKLTPDYPIGCKRMLFSSNYYEAISQPNVDVVIEPIQEITARGLRTRDGQEFDLDAIIYGSGFKATEFIAPMQVTGADGQDLQQVWRDGAEAYKGVAMSGFPNFFMLYGPNTNLGSNSIIFMIECQVGYILQCVQALQTQQLKALEVKSAALQRYNEDIQRQLAASVWSAGCSSWYHTAAGKVTNNWPGYTRHYRRQMATLDIDNFEQIGA